MSTRMARRRSSVSSVDGGQSSFVRLRREACNVDAAKLEGFDRVFFDAALGHLACVRGSAVTGVALLSKQGATPAVELGASVHFAKFSLSCTMVAAQVDEASVLVAEVGGTQRFRVDIKKAGMMMFTSSAARILDGGIVWAEHGGSSEDLLILGSRGCEMYKVSLERKQCKHVRSLTYDLRAFWYCAPRRLLCLGCEGDFVRPYWLRRAAGDMPRFELPPPEKVKRLELPRAANVTPVTQEDVSLVAALYGETCIVHVERARRDLRLYIVKKDKCVPWRVLKLHVPDDLPPRISVVDNLLYAHFSRAAVSLAFDPRPFDSDPDVEEEPVCAAMSAVVINDENASQGLYTREWLALGESRFLHLATAEIYCVEGNLATAQGSIAFLLRRKEGEVASVVAERLCSLVRDRASTGDLEKAFNVLARAEKDWQDHVGAALSLLPNKGDVANAVLVYVAALQRQHVTVQPELVILTLFNNNLLHSGILPDSAKLAKHIAASEPDLACDMLYRLRLWRDLLELYAENGKFAESLALCRGLMTPQERREKAVAVLLAKAAIHRVASKPRERRATFAALQRALKDWKPAALRGVTNEQQFPFHLFEKQEATRLESLINLTRQSSSSTLPDAAAVEEADLGDEETITPQNNETPTMDPLVDLP